MMKQSLRTKGLLLVLFSLIPLLIAGAVCYVSVSKTMEQSIMEQTSSKQNNNAGNLSAWLSTRRAEIIMLSNTTVITSGTDADKLSYLNKERVRLGFVYHSLGYIGLNGTMIQTDGMPGNIRNDSYVLQAFQGATVLTDPIRPGYSQEKQVLILVPVYGSNKEVQGVVYASILMSELEPYLNYSLDGSDVNDNRVYNAKGEIVYEAEKDGTRLLDQKIWNRLDANKLKNGSGMEKLKIGGRKHVLFYSKVDNTSWYLAVDVPLSRLLEKLYSVLYIIIISISLAEACIILLFSIYFNRIINRLKSILSVTEHAAAGRFEADRLPEATGDEIGQLARSVNGMNEHLREMFERLDAIINQNQYAFIILNEQLRIAGLNTKAEELLGYRLSELENGATPLIFLDDAEVRDMAARLSEELGKEVKPGLEVLIELQRHSYQREWTYIAKDGTRTPVLESSNSLHDRNGKLTGMVLIAFNNTERKQVEMTRNRLLEIVESAKDLIASADTRGNLIYINGAGRKLLNIGEDEHKDIRPFFKRHAYAKLMKGAFHAFSHGYWEGDMELLAFDGGVIHVSAVVVAHHDKLTGELYYSCIARDIAEQITVQEELMRAKLEAEEANQAKSRFLALMSHEIRTPLNGIIGLSQLVRKTGLSETQKEYMDKISSSSDTLLRLVNDILDFSKIEAGKVDMERFAFQPEELLRKLTDQLSVFMGGKENFEFIVMTPSDLPNTMIGDPLRLEQILLNLSMNAIKFTNRGRVVLKLDVKELTGDSAVIRFQIKDTGIGMTADQLSRLFKPFTQADSSTTRKYGGTGLGLFIATHFIEIMGGKLKAESVHGIGSRFWFTLTFPVAPSSLQKPYQVVGADKERPAWIVENDPEMAALLCRWLESFGLAALVFYSWKEVRARLQRVGVGALPGLMLLDMEMEDMYGMETWMDLQRQAREQGVHTAVMTTTYGRDELLQLPEAARPSTVLAKPITRLALLNALNGMFERTSEENPSPSRPLIEPPPAYPHIRVLLVEDNKINQLVSVEGLKAYGFMVGLAENGREALEKLEQEEWHIVLMDIHMPEMDGEEAVRRIRENPKYERLPVIALTANGLKADHDRYIRLGMNDVITKPVDARQLYETVVRWLGKPEQVAAAREIVAAADRPGLPVKRGNPRSPKPKLPAISGLDMPSLLARVGGKEQIVRHMLRRFVQDYELFAQEVRSNLAAGNMSEAKKQVHTLKGASGNLSALQVMDAATEIDNILRRQTVAVQDWLPAMERLERHLAALLQAIQAQSI
ncbi:response regulator [Paenibacillus protaetiae]|uniref:Circadian input-output histidine kinase CikA n=1 Tax=Paenibacillus protaetiae TaxID=2509456 RepID=A0A4P6EVT9_9BACL|nr:response regulator [Paenibacillus protaetiae]QAY67162.1 response regulator [Paenibacillus protaetiae]